MKKTLMGVAIVILALGGCRRAEVISEPSPGQPAPPPPTADEVPAGTLFEAELNQTIGTRHNRVGDRFTATVRRPLIALNGQTVIPAGAVITGVITGLDDSDHIGDQAAIRIDFERISFGGRSYPFSAEVVEADVETEGRDVTTGAAVGAAAGAVLGAIIGGDLEDILVGGALGAGAGTIISLGVGNVEAALPSGTDLPLRTTRNISLR